MQKLNKEERKKQTQLQFDRRLVSIRLQRACCQMASCKVLIFVFGTEEPYSM